MTNNSTVLANQLIREVNPYINIYGPVMSRPHLKQFSVFSKKSSTKLGKTLYSVKIQSDTPKITNTSKLRVYCSCLDFRYRLAYCLDLKGALLTQPDFILEHPTTTNPDCIVRGCQHISTAIRHAIQRNI